MAIYEVYLPGNGHDDASSSNALTARSAGAAKFLRERPSIIALILPAIWLLWHRLWWGFAAYLLVAFAIAGLGNTSLAPASLALSILPGLYLWLEGNNWIADKCQRAGYELAGLVDAETSDDAEAKWFMRQQITDSQHFTPVSHGQIRTMPINKDEQPEFGLFAED